MGLRLNFPNDLGLVQPLENGIDMIAKLLVRPVEPTRDIENTFETICPHTCTLQTTDDI